MSADFWEEFTNAYETATPITNSNVPDGEYEVTVTHCGNGFSKNKGTKQIEWGFTIATGQHTGRKLFKDQCITVGGMGFVRGDFQKVFPQDWDLKQCGASLDTLIGARLRVKAYTKKGESRLTVDILERLDTGGVTYAASPVAPPAPAPAQQPALPGIPANNGSPFG